MHGRFRTTDGAVATMGTLLHLPQASLIAELDPEEVVFLYDNDAIAKAYKAAEVFSTVSDIPTSIISLPDERDPDEMPDEELRYYIAHRDRRNFLSLISTLLGS